MNCPLCKADSRVLRTTGPERRRECVRCGHRWTSVEITKDEHERDKKVIETMKAVAHDVLGSAPA
jgi:transcriptional regulator NrdR family protein